MNAIEFGDCRETMRRWAADGVRAQTCVTSPPYFGLRDYGHPDQIGLEPTPEAYVSTMVEVFRCVRDVLTDDGTLWLNIGDSYARPLAKGGSGPGGKNRDWYGDNYGQAGGAGVPDGLKPKDLIGIPWMLAFALRADGWYLRQDIIWHKQNPMPESVRDRCTKAHEYLFLLSKSKRYHFDSEAMKEPAETEPRGKSHSFSRKTATTPPPGQPEQHRPERENLPPDGTRNRRSVWTVATKPYSGAHFATFPPDLVVPCILAGSRPGDIVLDPFMGSGTTAAVAVEHGRQYLGCELNPAYAELQQRRLAEAAQQLDLFAV